MKRKKKSHCISIFVQNVLVEIGIYQIRRKRHNVFIHCMIIKLSSLDNPLSSLPPKLIMEFNIQAGM